MANVKSYCTACGKLKDSSAEFIQNGVTDSICTSLGNDTGLNPENGNNTCTDMENANDCLTKGLYDIIDGFDLCDWKLFMSQYANNDYNMKAAMICWMCGLQDQLYNLQLQNLAIETQYTIQQSTPGLSVEIDRQGNFTFRYSDWIHTSDYEKVADGVITGKVDFCMKPNKDKSATYKFNSVTLKHYSYKMTGVSAGSAPTVSIRVPNKSGSLVYQKITNASFEEDINKTVELSMSGTVKAGETTNWLQFLSIYVDWLEDDEISLHTRFVNDNKVNFVICRD